MLTRYRHDMGPMIAVEAPGICGAGKRDIGCPPPRHRGISSLTGVSGMGRRTVDGRTRMANPEAAAAELAEHYARILGQHADRQVSDITRTCLRRLP